MTYALSSTFKSLNAQINKETMLVLEIEGSNYLYGSAPILERAKWDDPRIKWDNVDGYTWDGTIEKANSKPYISLKGGTTKSISQQLIVDKGGAGSITTMNIELVDYRGEVAKDLSFDNLGDPLSKKANVYLGIKGGVFPEDFIKVISGYVDDLNYLLGAIQVSVTLNTNLTRQPIFEQYQTIATSAIDSTQTTIPVETIGGLYTTQDVVTSYIKIDDEIMEVVSIGANTVEVVRERLGTIAASHEEEAEVLSHYTMEDHPIDLALKILHSSEGNSYTTYPYKINSLNRINSTDLIEGAIVVNDANIQDTLGLVVGDKLELTGSTVDGEYTVVGFDTLITGKSYILVDSPLTEETGLELDLKIKSKYDVLADGCGLDISFVDTIQFEEVKELFSTSFIDFSSLEKETIENARDFIISEIFQVQGLYLVPRKAKTSIKYVSPPFSAEEIPVLNTSTLIKMQGIQAKRSTHKYLYNSVLYRYNPGVLEDKFFDKYLKVDADSQSRITVGKKRLTVDAKGLKRSTETTQFLDRVSKNQLNRYKFAARYIRNVKPLLEVGLPIEIGDIVYFGGEDTQMVNIETGERDFPLTQYEVINKNLSLNEVSLDLLETGFGVDGIFAVFSPSSYVASGSTTTQINISTLWDSSQFEQEKDKWTRWEGAKIRVRSQDYTYDETTTFTRISPSNPNALEVEALTLAPSEGYVVELATLDNYNGSSIDTKVKITYSFTMNQGEVSVFNSLSSVDVVDSSIFAVGDTVQIHENGYVRDSSTVIIDDIVGNTLTFNKDLDVTPQVGDLVEIYSTYESKGYRIL